MAHVQATQQDVVIEAFRDNDPYGPTHQFYVGIKGHIPQPCSAAEYQCVRVLAGQPNAKEELLAAVPKMSDIQFAASKGLDWSQWLANHTDNSKSFRQYAQTEADNYLSAFVEKYK